MSTPGKTKRPGSPSQPPRRRKRRRRNRTPWWKTVLLVLLTVVLLALAGGASYVLSKLHKIHYDDGSLTPADTEVHTDTEVHADAENWQAEDDLVDISGLEMVDVNPVPPAGEITQEDQVFNILLLGTDYPYNSNDPGRADAIMILSLDFRDNSARLVSLERGMGMPILSGPYAGQWDWYTHLYHYGGAGMMLESLRYCFKIDVDRYAQVDFEAFKGVVDALGGIDIELTDAEAARLKLSTGWNHLNGDQALSYARLRSIDSDWVRITRQRRVIQACIDRIRDADLTTLNRLADTILPMISTNLTQGEILSLMTKAPKFMGVQFEQMTIPKAGTFGGMMVMGGRGAFAPDFEENSRILKEFLYGTE